MLSNNKKNSEIPIIVYLLISMPNVAVGIFFMICSNYPELMAYTEQVLPFSKVFMLFGFITMMFGFLLLDHPITRYMEKRKQNARQNS